MPLAPRLHSTRGGSSRTGQNVSMSRTGIEEATNSVAVSGSSTPSSAATAGSLRLARPRARRGSPRPRCSSAAAPACQPVRVRGHGWGRRQRGQRRGGLECERVGEHGRRVLPWRPRGRAPPGARRRSGLRARRAAAWTPADRPPAGPASGRCDVANGSIAQQRVVVSDRGRSAARAGQRVGQQRPAGGLAERRRRLAQTRLVALVAPGHEDAAPGLGHQLAQPLCAGAGTEVGAGRCKRRAARVWPGLGPACLICRQWLVRDERLAQREVQVHRPRTALQRVSSRRGTRASASSAAARGLRSHACRPRQNHLAALPNSFNWSIACPAPFSRSSGGRSAVKSSSGTRASSCLDCGRQQLGRGGPRGARHRHRQPRSLRRARARRTPRSARPRGSGTPAEARARA